MSKPRSLAAALLAAALLAAAALLPAACDDGGAAPAPAPAPPATSPSPAAPAPAPAAAPSTGPFPAQFVDLHEETTGFGPVNHTGVPGNKQWIAEAMGGAAILFDYDGDGDVDILFVDGNICAEPPHPEARSRLYRNDGGFRFVEVTREAGIDITEVGYGGSAADYDNDGDRDVFVGVLGRNHLLRNNGNGTFTDVAGEAGVQGPERDMSTACTWADFDGNGWLDLYVSNYLDMLEVVDHFRKEGRIGRSCDWRGFKVYCGPMGLPYQLDRLYLSNGPDPATGKVTFRDATANLADQQPRPSFQCIAADYDADGDMDVYVATDTEPNHLWINDGKGNFQDQGMEAGCAYAAQVVPQAGMGVDVADYDHDGLLDITVTNFSHDYNTVYRNRSRPRKSGGMLPSFEDVTVSLGVNLPTFIRLCWSAHFLDADNDGDHDLFYSAGHVYGEIDNFKESGTSYRQKNLLLEQVGGAAPRYVDASERAGPSFQVEEVHRGGGQADLDDDGDMDLVIAVLNGKAYIARNDGGNANAWIRLSLRGKGMLDPAGALVRVEAPGLLPQTDAWTRGDSFLSCSDPRMLFGLGKAGKASKVTVTWPSGAKQEFRDLDARAHWLLEEGAPAARRLER